ncbi:MAG TPA: PA2169 family four-helix-bundle protein [Anaerolineae bacterium]|nr:PA2169 family four-helix-bundle protein [Anaerolineae bacterium]
MNLGTRSTATAPAYVSKDEKRDTVDKLNELIEANRGLIKVYKTAMERLENEANIKLLQECATQHDSYRAELSNCVVSYGGEPETGADNHLVTRAWITLKSLVKDGDEPILQEVAEDMETLIKEYGETMQTDLPDKARDLVRRQMSEMRVEQEKLEGLSALG